MALIREIGIAVRIVAPSREFDVDEQLWLSSEIAQQRLGHADGSPITELVYTHVISEDGKRVAAPLGDAVW
jgi:hypothetical protein